jgi:hypothetical protein
VTGVFLSASPKQVRAALLAAQIIIEDARLTDGHSGEAGSGSGVILNPAFLDFWEDARVENTPPEIVPLSREQFLSPIQKGELVSSIKRISL